VLFPQRIKICIAAHLCHQRANSLLETGNQNKATDQSPLLHSLCSCGFAVKTEIEYIFTFTHFYISIYLKSANHLVNRWKSRGDSI